MASRSPMMLRMSKAPAVCLAEVSDMAPSDQKRTLRTTTMPSAMSASGTVRW